MATVAPILTFITSTRGSISVEHEMPNDVAYDHSVITAFNITDDSLDATFDPVTTTTFSVTGLTANKMYLIQAVAVDTSGDNSPPSNPIVAFTEEAPATPVFPALEITAFVVRGDGTVKIDYELCNPTLQIGDLTDYVFSISGDFTDAMTMSFGLTPEHEGVFSLDYADPAIEHVFIWDVKRDFIGLGQPDFSGTVKIRMQGRVATVDTTLDTADVVLDLATISLGRDFVSPGNTITLQTALFDSGAPIDPATVEITSVLDPLNAIPTGVSLPITGTMVSTGVYSFPVPIDAAALTGVYRYTISANDPGAAPFDWEVDDLNFFSVVEPTFDAQACNVQTDSTVLYGTFVDASGAPLINTTLSVTYSDERVSFTRVARRPVVIMTNNQGFFCTLVLRNTSLLIYASDFPFAQKIRVPDAPLAEFRAIQTNQPAVLARDAFGNPI